MTIKCAYHACKKEVDKDKAVKSELLYRHGNQTKREWREYCSEQCASHDQMAHEG